MVFSLVIEWLKETIGDAMSRDDVKAVVLSVKHGSFYGEFDINQFQKAQQTGDLSLLPDAAIGLVLNTIEGAKKPIVIAIEGSVVGVGLEVAMGCHARISTLKGIISLPELSLGIIPGAGGTQRLPRLVELRKALAMMLTSEAIQPEEGKELGLIDAIVPPEHLLKVSRKWALDIAEKRKPWVRSIDRTNKIGSQSDAQQIINTVREKFRENRPLHQACLDVIEEGIVHGGNAGLQKEAKIFNRLVVTDTAKGLLNVFFSKYATSKVPNVTDIGLKPRAIKKVAVIGGGLIGSGIATALILRNIYVVLKEIESKYPLKRIKVIEENIRRLVTSNKLAQSTAKITLSMIKGVLDYSELQDVDMVIEAVIEDVQLKQDIFSEIEKACPPHCIFATSMSNIDLNLVGEKLKSKERVVGAHFFSPTNGMPLLEIVRTEKTSPQVILDLFTVGHMLKKVPVVVENCTGFAVNRTLFTYKQSAHILLHLGVDLFRIDRLIRRFGFPMGPFQLEDSAGYDVAVALGKEFATAYPDRTFMSPLFDLLIENGRNGINNGKGYYIYEKGCKPKPDPLVIPIIEKSRNLANLMPQGKPISVTDGEIVEMVLFPLVNEACRVLEEGIIVRASDLDIASVLGMSFPSHCGGIIFWADSVGSKHIYTSLKKWSEKYGNFYTPSRFLEEQATNGVPLKAPIPYRGRL